MSRLGPSFEVTGFILDKIDSVEQLEILLLLAGQPEKPWTATEIAKELRSSPRSANAWLENLEASSLVVSTPGKKFQFSTENLALQTLIGNVAEAYATYRVALIELIFNKPLHRIRGFAQSFQLRSNKDK